MQVKSVSLYSMPLTIRTVAPTYSSYVTNNNIYNFSIYLYTTIGLFNKEIPLLSACLRNHQATRMIFQSGVIERPSGWLPASPE